MSIQSAPAEGSPTPDFSAPSTAAAQPPEPQPPPPLNRRREKFCEHFALSGNAAEAARAAGYAERSANNHGFRLLNDPRIREYIYALRVNRAVKFGPVTAFARLENLFQKASADGNYRAAASILILQARLAGLESWKPLRPGRGAPPESTTGPRGPDPFDNLSENGGLPENGGTQNDD